MGWIYLSSSVWRIIWCIKCPYVATMQHFCFLKSHCFSTMLTIHFVNCYGKHIYLYWNRNTTNKGWCNGNSTHQPKSIDSMPYYELGGLQELNLVAHPPSPKKLLNIIFVNKTRKQNKWHKWQAQAKMDGEKKKL